MSQEGADLREYSTVVYRCRRVSSVLAANLAATPATSGRSPLLGPENLTQSQMAEGGCRLGSSLLAVVSNGRYRQPSRHTPSSLVGRASANSNMVLIVSQTASIGPRRPCRVRAAVTGRRHCDLSPRGRASHTTGRRRARRRLERAAQMVCTPPVVRGCRSDAVCVLRRPSTIGSARDGAGLARWLLKSTVDSDCCWLRTT